MHPLLRSYYYKVYKGLHPRLKGDRSELKRVGLILRFLMLAMLGVLALTVLDTLFGQWFNLLLDLVEMASFLAALYLIYCHSLKASKLFIFSAVNLLLLLIASSQGPQAGNAFIFFPLLMVIFILFSYRQWRYLLFCAALTLANFIYLESTSYASLQNPALPTYYPYLNYLANFLISVAMVAYFSWYHAKANSRTEQRLKKLNHHLESRNQALVKTNAELDSFVYKASHDLRAPLTSLLGLISISQMESDPDQRRHYGQLQEKLIRKLDSYILDILTISRNSNLPVEMAEIDFQALIDQSLEQLQYLENFSRVETILDVHPPSDAFHSDPKRLSIIFNNLLANAFRYADPSKPQAWLRIELQGQAGQVTMVVSDNGIGIDGLHLGKIFQMFYRATDRAPGSGLGLYIVREITHRLGGRVTVSSQLGQGSRFEICLPNALGEQLRAGSPGQQLPELAIDASRV